MRTRQRLLGIKRWVEKDLCKGRAMKTMGENIADIVKDEPRCFLGWMPSRPDISGHTMVDIPVNVAPSIIVMPNPSKVKFMEEKRFDRYNKVSRPQDLGQSLSVSMLFAVYEPGIRLPGFIESADAVDDEGKPKGLDMRLLAEGTEEGLFTLFDWMDDARERLLEMQFIPNTDLFVNEESMTYGPYTDSNYVIDKRPLYYGFLNVEFGCYADAGASPKIQSILDG